MCALEHKNRTQCQKPQKNTTTPQIQQKQYYGIAMHQGNRKIAETMTLTHTLSSQM